MVSFAVGAITATVSVTGLLDLHVLATLERQPGELEHHDAWRPATSLVVHDDWLALASNLVLLAVVGIAAERRLSRVEWLTLYLCAGLTGQLVGVAWQPHGAGNSVASLRLAGGLVVAALRARCVPVWALGYAAVVLAQLMAPDVGGTIGAAISISALVLTGAVYQWRLRRPHAPLDVALAWRMGLEGIALAALGNIHGPALLAGVVVAAVWTAAVMR